ncbi:efflux RND transporter periplasmic adaptor subunit [Rhizobium oryzicola]|uniref:Efflux RND transporter periplasmic adaptor subunit n=1 Tax=Rhizobium oryzicola TaxID=1232668 RepID=A0ABT8T2C3_9HYPH|nr:efflux RND transporter periplasmic adaptor subunit [Rhizobium oryzicola]MDO1584894.1 efflux RND transporter periplasmic adaptor subunit [Rhizobium oryzicola]
MILTPLTHLHAQEGVAAPPAAVGVIALKTHPIPFMSELPGRIAATRVSEVRARVSGILQERIFQQGSVVKQGEVLYRIDPRLFKVRVQSAEASLQKAKAVQVNAQQQFDRQKTLRERSVSTGVDFDAAAANLAQANAEVALQQAALDEAKINLDYTEVRAPITGIIGAALVTEGALVTAEGTSSLALIQQVNPVYVDFTQSVQDLLALKRAVAEGKLSSPSPGAARVELVFDGGETYSQAGKLLFSNASVDPNTGQVMLRAEFPNDRGELLPGMYVRVRVEQAIQQSGLTVPQRAVTRDADGKPQVYVLAKDNTAQTRQVALGAAIDAEWIVLSGLQAGETIIVDGAQKIQPGAKVVPEVWSSPKQSAADDKAK